MSRDYCDTAERTISGVSARKRSPDALLSSFLQTTDRAEADDLLAVLICEHAQPLIQEIIKGKLHGYLHRPTNGGSFADAEDIASGVVLKLLKRLNELKSEAHTNGIPSFRDYVAIAAYNACHEYLRQKYPERSRLKNKLRYILTRHEGLALWAGQNRTWLCGLAIWREQQLPVVSLKQLRPLWSDAADSSSIKSQLVRTRNIVEQVESVLQLAGGPVALDDLINLMAELWGIKDCPPLTDDDSRGAWSYLERATAPDTDPATRVEQRMQLARLWAEICALSLPQRRALLLGLKDAGGRCLTVLLADIRIASLTQIAEALAMPAEQLAELWTKIPLDDLSIAAHFGIAREQVIHQRQSARRRLARRMKAFS